MRRRRSNHRSAAAALLAAALLATRGERCRPQPRLLASPPAAA